MSPRAALLLCLLTALGLSSGRAEQFPLRRSQLFTVLDGRPVTATSPGQLKSPTGESLVRLDPDVLLLSAERIREALYWVLGLPNSGGGDIRMVLYPATRADNLLALGVTPSPPHWKYQLDVPDQVDPEKLVRGVVGALLLEFANRGQGPKSAEIPLWLVEGLARHVSEVAGPDLVIRAVPLGSMLQIVRERHGLDYLKSARSVLRAHAPMTFVELAQPDLATLSGDKLKVFQSSAQLFVYELLHFEQGPAKLLSMLRDLPHCWNWDTALLRAYATEFHSLLDVEKRWSVDVLAFTSNDPNQVRTRIAWLDRLQSTLSITARVSRKSNALPERTTLTLQQAIATWEFSAQVPVLRQKLASLASLRLNVTPDLVPLIDGYQKTLVTYLTRRSQAGRSPENRMQVSYNPNLVADDAIRELDLLDQRRAALGPVQSLSVNSPTSSSR